jgi:outer membrane protein assembly factor BamB
VFDGDYATTAIDTATGTRLWATRFSTPGTMFETGADVAVSPDGSRVYVIGGSTIWSGHGDAITQAYNATNGTVVWTARNNATPDRAEAGWRATIAGSRLVVAGSTSYSIDSADPLNVEPGSNSSDYLVYAYDLP